MSKKLILSKIKATLMSRGARIHEMGYRQYIEQYELSRPYVGHNKKPTSVLVLSWVDLPHLYGGPEVLVFAENDYTDLYGSKAGSFETLPTAAELLAEMGIEIA